MKILMMCETCCNEIIGTLITTEQDDDVKILIPPCDECMDNAFQDGKESTEII